MNLHLEPAALIAIVGVLGIGSQYIAWRLRLPGIVLMLVAGILAGPVLGILDPEQDLGDLFSPLVSIAVALILFEGGLTLDFKGLRDARPAVRRMVYLGAPLGWLFSVLAIHFGAGLSWQSASVFGGILVVTGPTVVTPLLRQARLAQRPASILRWEAIVNDPVGAMFAVLAFEGITALSGASGIASAAWHLVIGIGVAVLVGYGAGWLIARSFKRGQVPEYMKVPVLFGAVLAVYAATDMLLHESGLLAVTVMGVFIGNADLPSLRELKRFKEHSSVILVSGVFILLAASLKAEMVTSLDWRAGLFVVAIVVLVRPVTILTVLLGTGLPWQEKAFIAWIAPRGVVAVAVSGLFGARLVELGVADGALLAPLAFALVTATVVLHGFSIRPLARVLGLTSREPPGVLIVGSHPWSVALAKQLREMGLPVLVADWAWSHLYRARVAEIPVFYGEILSEAAEYSVDLNRYGHLIAATDNDAYNALICTDFGPEFGRNNVYQLGRHEKAEDERHMPASLGGRSLGSGLNFDAYSTRLEQGWEFSQTRLSPDHDLKSFLQEHKEAEVLAALNSKGEVDFQLGRNLPDNLTSGDILSFSLSRAESPEEEKHVG